MFCVKIYAKILRIYMHKIYPVSQLADQLPTACSIAHSFGVNAGVYEEDYAGNPDVTIQHNNNAIERLRRRVQFMSVPARQRGYVSET